MDSKLSYAPADHFSRERLRLRELRGALAALRKELPLLRRVAAGTHHGAISACAALCAYLPARALGLQESFWCAITAISVVQTEFQATETTARDQFIGAAIGGGIGVCAAFVPGPQLLLYSTAIILSMLTCWALNIPSASRIAGTTATIILLVPHTGSPERMFGARLSEVGWGVCVAIVVVWLAGRLPASRARPLEVKPR
jgi:uncharacterized membrane protein YccC